MSLDPDEQRAESLERWERVAAGWAKRADRIRQFGMPVSLWMIKQLGLRYGQRVLELACGPGDTGFVAAELIQPGGTLVSSDAAETMLDVARARARELGIENVEFARLELEWIDLPTASVDAVICRWGLMLTVDPDAAAQEIRRVLRPGGRVGLAVWDEPARNPWATISTTALLERGLASPPDPNAPGMFALAAPGQLQDLLESAGFLDVVVEPVAVKREYARIDMYIDEMLDVSPTLADVYVELDESEQEALRGEIVSLAAPLLAADGSVTLPGAALVAAASA